MLTHEIEARNRLHDHVMDEPDLRRSPVRGREAEPACTRMYYTTI